MLLIDLQADTLIPITEVPAILERRGYRTKYGKPVALRTVQDWAQRGRLETTPARYGQVRHTTLEAIERCLASSGVGVEEAGPSHGRKRTGRPRRQTERARADAAARANAACEAEGW